MVDQDQPLLHVLLATLVMEVVILLRLLRVKQERLGLVQLKLANLNLIYSVDSKRHEYGTLCLVRLIEMVHQIF